jgi:rod shape determining protein RodA
MVLVFLCALMIFYAGIHWAYIVAALALAAVSAPLLYNRLSDIQKLRIINFLHPENDPMGSNYQILQGMIAIGSGKLTGQGYLQGTQTRFGFIPEQDSDYIFSALVEQFGFIGGLILILLYFFLLFRIMVIASQAKDEFERGLCVGVAAMIFIHVFENIGMTIGLMPVTGIPLPFVSNGGTFQLVNMTLIGIVLSVGTQRRPLDFNAEL